MDINYNMIGAYLAGIRKHPQEVIKELGIKYKRSESFTISDSWIFYDCELKDTGKLPSFLSRSKQ